MRLGEYFTLEELTVSSAARAAGIPNGPVLPHVMLALTALVENLLDPLRRYVGRPIEVTSGFRTPAVNALVGGSRTSDHMTGHAADIKCAGLTRDEFAKALIASRLPFDQLIGYERTGHIHVSYRATHNRGARLWQPATGRMVSWRI